MLFSGNLKPTHPSVTLFSGNWTIHLCNTDPGGCKLWMAPKEATLPPQWSDLCETLVRMRRRRSWSRPWVRASPPDWAPPWWHSVYTASGWWAWWPHGSWSGRDFGWWSAPTCAPSDQLAASQTWWPCDSGRRPPPDTNKQTWWPCESGRRPPPDTNKQYVNQLNLTKKLYKMMIKD